MSLTRGPIRLATARYSVMVDADDCRGLTNGRLARSFVRGCSDTMVVVTPLPEVDEVVTNPAVLLALAAASAKLEKPVGDGGGAGMLLLESSLYIAPSAKPSEMMAPKARTICT